MFKNAQVGDRVYDYIRQEWGTVTRGYYTTQQAMRAGYPIEVTYAYDEKVYYTLKGQNMKCYPAQILFWDIPKITQRKKPLPKLKIDTKVLVWMSNTGIKYKRYFSHFTDNNKIACFKYGGTSWNKNDTLEWDNWELYDEED